MQEKTNGQERGAVLIITLITLSLVTVLAIQISRYTLFDHSLARLNLSHIESKLHAESAKNLFSKLATQKKTYTGSEIETLNTKWNTILPSLFTTETTSIITDENSLFPINAMLNDVLSSYGQLELQKVMHRLLLVLLQTHAPQLSLKNQELLAEDMLDSMLQWTGVKPLTEEHEAWYQTQDPPYLPPKNAFENPIDLTLLYFPNLDTVIKDKILYGDSQTDGLIKLVSVWSNGPLNISTLHPLIVEGLLDNPSQAKNFAKEIAKTRQEKNITDDSNWYDDIFKSHGGKSLPVEIMSDKTRMLRLQLKIGNEKRFIQYVGIGILFNDEIRWYYQKIQ